MKKRLVSILLVLVMVLGMLPTVAFAADTAATRISTEDEFVAMAAGGNYILTQDITITKPHSGDFQGHFDGNGHTITLSGMTSGPFGIVNGPSTIENLKVAGSVTGTSYLAGIAGMANTADGEIKIINCMNTADITGTSPVGGIVGGCTSSANTLTIQGCANLGDITGSSNKVGGIIGVAQYAAHKIVDCYNQGKITGFNNYAGIVGHNGGRTQGVASQVTVQNCYSTGAIEKYGTSTNAGYAIVGGGTGANTTNSYALTGVAEKLCYVEGTNCAFKTDAEMKEAAFAALLGDGFMAKAGSYPTLAWEVPTASKTFHITPAAATLTVLKGSETAYSGTGAEQTVSLPAGTYTYTVSCAGYETKNGDAFTVSEKEANDGATLSAVTVSLNEDASAWVSLTVTKNPASALVTIKDAAGNTVAETNGSYKLLKDGAYTYTATTTEEGYEDAAGSVDPTAGTLTIDLPKVDSLTVDTTNAKTTYFQNEKLKTDGLVLTVHYTNADDKEISAADFAAKGVTAAFDSSKEGTADVLLSYKGKSVSYQVEIQGRPDVFQQLRPYATITYGHNSSYTGNDEEEFAYDEEEGALQSKSQGMGNSQVWVSIKLNENAPAGNISFQYKTESEANFDYMFVGSSSYTKYNKTVWTKESFSLQPGEELKLTYKKDGSGDTGKDCVWLKDFTFERLYTIELTTVPSDASLTLKDEAGTTVTGTNGKYTVTPGTYTYEASAFGYETATDTIKVTDKDVSKTITLQQLPGQTVTFDLEIPETIPAEDKNSYTITIKQGAATVRTLKGENTTTLPAGEYTYTITHPNCDDVTGSFTVSGSAVTETKTLTRKLVFSDFFADCKGITATNHERRPWKAVKDEANGNYLTTESVATGFGSSDKTTILFEAADNVRLSFDVVPYCYGSSNRFVIYKNNKSVKTYDRSDKWESYSIDLLTGDTLLLEYTPHGSTYYTRLKNFKTEQLAKVNFTLGTAGASLVFTNKETGATYEPANGASSIVLPAGTYTYTASKFGCEDATGEFTVAGGETKNITVPALTELKNATVTFHVTLPEDCKKPYTVVICKSGEIVYNETISEDAAESCTLPVGTYTYTVSHAKCDDAAGELELAEAGGEIRVTLARKPVFEDFFAKCDGIIAANSNVYPYKAVKDAAGDYLISDSVRNYGKATITLTAEKALRLYFSYYATSDEDCPFVVKNGTKTLLEAYGETTWKTFATDLAAGDKLTLTYEQPYVYGGGESPYHVKLKDFRTEALSKVTFTLGTEGTVITVKNAKGDVVTPDKDGSYTLPDGNYTYTASKFGYKTVENVSFTVGGEDKNIHVEVLQPMPSAAITFQTDPVDAAVSVTHAAQGAQTANDDGTYTLVEGETYDYTVSKENYVSKSGAITVSGDETITVKLTYAGIGWDGTTKTEPKKSADGTYQISSAAELAWFADAVNNGSTALNAALTDNINLNGKTWPGIGTASNKYTGTFDGKYFMVSGLAGSKGLFDFVGACVIKNLTVSGAIKEGTNMGLLADVSAGTVENCFTTGSLHRINSYGTTGGLIGRADAGTVIRNCGSAANVSCSMKSLKAELNMGGLVGNLYGTVENSYATGTVKVEAGSGYTAVGGFIGQTKNTAAITNSYAAGTVTGSAGGALGAFVGVNSGSISGSYYREDAAEAAVATGSADGLTAMTKAVMQSDSFIKDHLGLERYHVDTDGINGGYPIHAWQGGKEAELTEDEKAVTLDVRALVLKDAKQAALVQELCAQVQEETDAFVAETSLSMLLAYIRDDWGYDCGVLTSPEDAKPYVYQQFCKEKEAEYLEEYGEQIDLSNTEGILTPDNNGIYHIKTQAQLALAATGENGSRISWHSDSDALNAETGAVTLPEADTITVRLTATAAKGTAEKSREITVILYSVKAEAGNVLGSIEKALSAKDAFVQPVQIRGHETAMDAVSYWLYDNGYDDSIEVEFVSAGTLATTSVTGRSYLAEDGTVTYYQGEGGTDTKYVTYTGVQFKLSKLGAEKTVTANVRIGWDVEKAQELMQRALDEQLTWEAIRGENTNTAKASTDKSFTGMVVDGEVSEMLVAPRTVTVDGVAVRVGFSVNPSDAVTYEFTDSQINISPRRPSQGKPATTFELRMVTLFDENLDPYTISAMMSSSGDNVSTLQLQNAFRITVKPETEDAQNVLSQNLKDKLPGLVTNYYDYGAKVDLTKPVKDDLLIPSLQKMSDAGIFNYDYSQMQKLESLTPDVADVNGYHITVYRPLPGQPAVEAKIKVQICERVKVNGKSTPGKVLGETILTFTIEPLTQKEIDDAKALMTEVTQEEVYWQSIRGENTDKNHITTDLHPFYKIVKNDIGGYDYPTLGQVKNVEGIYTDDYPGYDPMASYGETYRTFYSSRRTIIKYENLLLTQPEYNTKVTIKSWLTYTQYAKYYEKFVKDAETPDGAYEQFATFYKHEVSTTVKVDGKQNIDEPEKPDTGTDIGVTVIVDGRDVDGFVSNKENPYAFEGKDTGDGITVAQVMQAFFKDTEYTSDSYAGYYGGYIAAITDPKGVKLEAATKERPYSGWMYTRNGEYADAINAEFVEDGDEIYFYYTVNYYLELDKNSDEYRQYKALADDVANKIHAIPDEISSDNAEAFEKAVTIARSAYNDLDAGIREAMLDPQVAQKLFDAEAKLAEYEKNMDVYILRGLLQEITDEKNVTESEKQFVQKAEELYEGMEPGLKKLVTKEESRKLTAARKSLAANERAAKKVSDLIASKLTGEPDGMGLNDRRTITSVETAYNKLTDAQKTFISEAEKATLDAFTARRDYLDANEAEMKANEKAASAVEKLIKALPKSERVDYTDKAEIEKARTAYDELTDDQKKLVSNLDTLTAAEAALRKALDDVAADKSAAEIVIEMIQALPETVVYDHDDKSDEAEIHAAREAYNNLGKVGKNIVGKDNLKLLTNAEKALKKAVSQDTKDQKAAAKVIAKIEKLPAAEDVIVKNKSAISAARKAYDRLNENAKKYADDSAEVIAKLADCEEALTQAIEDEDAAEAVEKLIKKLPTAKRVKEEHREKVQEALDAYNELTAEQKELVAAKNQQKLFDCCAALDISVDGGDIDLEALELQQEEASRQAAIIEQFVLAEDEDDASLEEDFDESVDE